MCFVFSYYSRCVCFGSKGERHPHCRGESNAARHIGQQRRRQPHGEVVVNLEVVQVSEDIGVNEIESIDHPTEDNHQLEVPVVRLVHIQYRAVGIVGVPFQPRGVVVVDPVEVLLLEGLHIGVVGMDKVS